MDFRHLTTSVKLIDCGSFTRAAETLGYTQSSITAHLQQLETELCVPLLDRQGRTIGLTEAGQELYDGAIEILRMVDHLSELRNIRGPLKGSLRLVAPEAMMNKHVEPILKQFTKNHPNITLSVANHTCHEAYRKLMEGKFDLALMFLPTYDDARLEVIRVSSEPLVLVAPANQEMTELGSFIHQQVLRVPLIVNEQECCYRMAFEQYLLEQSISYAQKIEIWGVESIKRLVMSGMGISLLPEACVSEELSQGRLQRILLTPPMNPITLHLACPKEKHRSRIMSALIEGFIGQSKPNGVPNSI